MKPVKWETVKLRACRDANLRGYGPEIAAVMEAVACGTLDWRGKYKELQELVWKRIQAWDIRQARKLRELFPSCLPANCRFEAFENEKGEWMLQ